jgi:hypothetical protein
LHGGHVPLGGVVVRSHRVDPVAGRDGRTGRSTWTSVLSWADAAATHRGAAAAGIARLAAIAVEEVGRDQPAQRPRGRRRRGRGRRSGRRRPSSS